MTNQTIHPCPKCEVVPEVDLCYTPTSVVVCCQLHPAYSVDTVLWVDLCDLHLGRACRELGIETVEQLKAKVQPDPRVAVLESALAKMLESDISLVPYSQIKVHIEEALLRSRYIAAQRGEEQI